MACLCSWSLPLESLPLEWAVCGLNARSSRTDADMNSSGRVLGNFTLARMCSQECLKTDAVAARRRRVFVYPCGGSAS